MLSEAAVYQLNNEYKKWVKGLIPLNEDGERRRFLRWLGAKGYLSSYGRGDEVPVNFKYNFED